MNVRGQRRRSTHSSGRGRNKYMRCGLQHPIEFFRCRPSATVRLIAGTQARDGALATQMLEQRPSRLQTEPSVRASRFCKTVGEKDSGAKITTAARSLSRRRLMEACLALRDSQPVGVVSRSFAPQGGEVSGIGVKTRSLLWHEFPQCDPRAQKP